MSEKIARPTWLDDADVAQFKKAEELKGQIIHLIYDKDSTYCAFISTFGDMEELAAVLRQTLERVESGEYEQTRKEINLGSAG